MNFTISDLCAAIRLAAVYVLISTTLLAPLTIPREPAPEPRIHQDE